MQIFFILILSGVLTILFDWACWKWEQKKEIDESWKAVNEQREREGKQRWDNM